MGELALHTGGQFGVERMSTKFGVVEHLGDLPWKITQTCRRQATLKLLFDSQGELLLRLMLFPNETTPGDRGQEFPIEPR